MQIIEIWRKSFENYSRTITLQSLMECEINYYLLYFSVQFETILIFFFCAILNFISAYWQPFTI